MRIFLTLLLCLAVGPVPARAQPAAPASDAAAIRAAVTDYFQANDRNDPALLERAFQPSLVMYSVDAHGALVGLELKRWAQRLKEATSAQPAVQRRIVWLEQYGDGASVESLSVFGDHQFRDFLTLLKIAGRWRIVGKVYARQPPGTPAAPEAEDEAQIRALIGHQFEAMDRNDGHLLGGLYDSRAQTFSVSGGELVAVSVGEWMGRFDAAAVRHEFPQHVRRRVEHVVVHDDVAWARFEHVRGARRVVDTALLARTRGHWRIVHLDYVVVAE